jgi:hypothetical protein
MSPNGLLVRQIEDEVLVLDTDADLIHQLNPSASMIWRLHAEGMPPNEIAIALVSEFGIDDDTAHRDVGSALTRFRELQLID